MRRSRSSPVVSLFPFLSVLSCVIGTLTLILAGTAMGSFRAVGVGSHEESVEVRTGLVAGAKEVSVIEQGIAEALAPDSTLDHAREELARLVETNKARDGERSVVMELLARLEELERQIARGEQALPEMQAGIQVLDARIADTVVAQDAAQQRVAVVPAGSGKGLAPWFIECTSAGLTFHADLERDQGTFVPFAQIGSSAVLKSFLCTVKAGADTGYVVTFLIRQGGVKSYDVAYKVAESSGVRHGCMPVVGQGKLDFSAYVSKIPSNR